MFEGDLERGNRTANDPRFEERCQFRNDEAHASEMNGPVWQTGEEKTEVLRHQVLESIVVFEWTLNTKLASAEVVPPEIRPSPRDNGLSCLRRGYRLSKW